MSVSQRPGAFLRKYKFLLPWWYFKAEAGRAGRQEMRTRDPPLPGCQQHKAPYRQYIGQGQTKGKHSAGGCHSAVFKLPIRMSKITWLEPPHPLQVNHTLLSLSFKSCFQSPDRNIQKDRFLTL